MKRDKPAKNDRRIYATHGYLDKDARRRVNLKCFLTLKKEVNHDVRTVSSSDPRSEVSAAGVNVKWADDANDRKARIYGLHAPIKKRRIPLYIKVVPTDQRSLWRIKDGQKYDI